MVPSRFTPLELHAEYNNACVWNIERVKDVEAQALGPG
jgi:hypothetical protein